MTESFQDYWDKRLDELKKECPGVLDKPIIMNAMYDEALKAWYARDSQPSGLRAVRECGNCDKGKVFIIGYPAHYEQCSECTGGLISRDIPISEAVEILNGLLTSNSEYAWSKYGFGENSRYITLPSGERVEVGPK